MNGELLQLMQLVVTTNHYLKTGEFVDCVSSPRIHSFSFLSPDGGILFWKKRRQDGILKWLKFLKSQGVCSIRLLLENLSVHEHQLKYRFSFFDNASSWKIVCDFQSVEDSAIWSGYWHFDQTLDKWLVVYTGYKTRILVPRDDWKGGSSSFIETLKKLEAFSERPDFYEWRQWFANARRRLEGEEIAPCYEAEWHGLLTEEQRKIFEALTWAWVFGGMGWWNDCKPSPKDIEYDEYEKLSKELYDGILKIVMYWANE